MQIVKKLIAESPNYEYDLIKEQKNSDETPRLYIQGPYFQYGVVNRNQRMYQEGDMVNEVQRYIAEDIAQNRAGGELEHSSAPFLDLRLMSDKILELKQEGNTFYGKSLVLSTPNGKILESLLNDGVQIGRSTRALGSIKETKNNVHIVEGFNLIAVDSVSTPSMSDAWVNGILESKEFICNENGRYEENFEKFEKGISKYPSKYRNEINQFLLEHVRKLMKSW